MSKNKNCSSIEHEKEDAIIYCQTCRVYMCNKCKNFHSKLCKNHFTYDLNKNTNEIFTGFCKEENHFDKLEFYCKTHNKLCCSGCIIKIKRKGKGQHTDCEICNIEDIKNEKKNKLKKNIESLEKELNNIDKSIQNLKNIFEKINENKEELKLEVQKIFTKIRNKLNNREEEILIEIDNKFDSLYFKEDFIKKCEKLPAEIKISLEKGKLIQDEWNNDDILNSKINDCINIENNLKKINDINKNIEKNSDFKKLTFFHDNNEEIDKFLVKIKLFGQINYTSDIDYKFKECQEKKDGKYIVTGENKNIITKVSKDGSYIYARCQNFLEKGNEYRWKIKILKSKNNKINIGIGYSKDINLLQAYKCGWFLYCSDLKFYSGPPQDYDVEKTNLNKLKDEIIVSMDMKKGILTFMIGEENDSISGIPLEQNLLPVVTLFDEGDSVQINKC